jgi:hypothetical protein
MNIDDISLRRNSVYTCMFPRGKRGPSWTAARALVTAGDAAGLLGQVRVCDRRRVAATLKGQRHAPSALIDVFLLGFSIATRNIGEVERLLQAGAWVHAPINGCSLLGWATLSGDLQIVEKLLDAGALDEAESGGRTAFALALFAGHFDVAQMLRARKVLPEPADMEGIASAMIGRPLAILGMQMCLDICREKGIPIDHEVLLVQVELHPERNPGLVACISGHPLFSS